MKTVLYAAALLIGLFGTLGVAPVVQDEPCIQAWWREREYEIEDYLDTAEIAGITGRGALSPIMLEMLRRYRAYERNPPPDCALSIYTDIQLGMISSFSGFEYFATEDADSGSRLSSGMMRDADGYYQSAYDALEEVGITADSRMDND